MSKYTLEFNGRWSAHLVKDGQVLRHPAFRFTDGDGGHDLKLWLEKHGSLVEVQPFTLKKAVTVTLKAAPAPKRAESPNMPSKRWKVQLKTRARLFTSQEEAAAYAEKYNGMMAEVML